MVTVVDYGLSNLLSVKRAIEECGEEVLITNDYHDLLKAEKIVLPGVGAFKDGMEGLKKYSLDKAIIETANRGIPTLAICLGMQMLLEYSEENGHYDGLKLIEGAVKKIDLLDKPCIQVKLPHIGWEKVYLTEKTKIDSSFEESEFYFVHSYEAITTRKDDTYATFNYGGKNICAIVGKNNLIGCQFHPEKSGKVGLQFLREFITCDKF